MATKVLVAYATKHGSTKEIAEKVAEVLGNAGLAVDLYNVKEAPDPSACDAVVVGAAAYMGRWRKEAVKYLKKYQTVLSNKPTWLFMSGPTGEGDPVELLKGVVYPPMMNALIESLKPREVKAFHGNTRADYFSGWEKWILSRVGADAADFRDWDMITAWAQSIAEELKT